MASIFLTTSTYNHIQLAWWCHPHLGYLYKFEPNRRQQEPNRKTRKLESSNSSWEFGWSRLLIKSSLRHKQLQRNTFQHHLNSWSCGSQRQRWKRFVGIRRRIIFGRIWWGIGIRGRWLIRGLRVRRRGILKREAQEEEKMMICSHSADY